MRQRIEDLGRISVHLENLLDMDVFDVYEGRPKDFNLYFSTLTEDKQIDLLNTMIYGIQAIKERLWILSSIANGQDHLNEEDSESLVPL
jgi:hypothetical protein